MEEPGKKINQLPKHSQPIAIMASTLFAVLLSYQNCGKVLFATHSQNSNLSNEHSPSEHSPESKKGIQSFNVLQVYKSGNDILAATDAGLSISRDDGSSWTTKTYQDGLPGNHIYGFVANASFICLATKGGLSYSTDFGATFTNVDVSKIADWYNHVVSIFQARNSKIYFYSRGDDGTMNLGISSDGCRTFIKKPIPSNPFIDFNSQLFVDDQGIIFIGSYRDLLVSKDQGNTFSQVTGLEAFSMCKSGTSLFVGTGTRGVIISTDNGETFINSNIPTRFVRGLSCGSKYIFAAGDDGLFRSDDSGRSWALMNNLPISSVFASEDDVLTAGYGLSISRDAGRTFGEPIGSASGKLNGAGMLAVDGQNIYIAGTIGLSHSADGGRTFSRIGFPRVRTILFGEYMPGIHVFKNNVYAMTQDRNVYVSRGHGQGFLRSPTALNFPMTSLAHFGGPIFGCGHGVFVSTDDGMIFEERYYEDGEKVAPCFSIAADGSNVYVGTPYGLAVSRDGGRTFSRPRQTPGSPQSDLIQYTFASNGVLWIVSNGTFSGVHSSSDGGRSFRFHPIFPPRSAERVIFYSVHARNSNVYVSTNNGFYVSRDAGSSFSIQQELNQFGKFGITQILDTGSELILNSPVNGYIHHSY